MVLFFQIHLKIRKYFPKILRPSMFLFCRKNDQIHTLANNLKM